MNFKERSDYERLCNELLGLVDGDVKLWNHYLDLANKGSIYSKISFNEAIERIIEGIKNYENGK